MKVIQAYRFALDLTPRQERTVLAHAGAARVAHNWALARVKAVMGQRAAERSYGIADAGLTPAVGWSLPALRRAWNAAKPDVAPWWSEVSKEAFSREPVVVIGLPVVAPFQDLSTLVPAAWRQLFDRRAALPQSADGTFAEASYHLGEGRYHEVVGVAVPPQTPVSGAWTLAHVPAGEWAYCRHSGPVAEIGETFGAVEQWLRDQGRTVGGIKLDLGYRADSQPQVHDLYVHVPGSDPYSPAIV